MNVQLSLQLKIRNSKSIIINPPASHAPLSPQYLKQASLVNPVPEHLNTVNADNRNSFTVLLL